MLSFKRDVVDDLRRDIDTAYAWYAGQLALARLYREREDVLACCYSSKRDERTGEFLHRRTCALMLTGTVL